MADQHDRDSGEQRRAQRVDQAEHGYAHPDGQIASEGIPAYSSSLLGSPVLSGRGNGPVKAAVMRQAQQNYGNRAVQRFIQRRTSSQQGLALQRETPNEQQSGGTGATGGSGGPARLEGSTVDITGAQVNINAGMTRATGVLQVDTLIANSVVSSNYTPGAGNTM